MSLTKDLRKWRKERNISNANTKVYVENVIEELLEIYYDDKEIIKYLQERIMFEYFYEEPIGEFNILDSIQDIQTFSINETELMGYDNELCNKEVFKEINSRKQDPKQKENWLKNGANGKWQKHRLQDKKTLYKADFLKCKQL